MQRWRKKRKLLLFVMAMVLLAGILLVISAAQMAAGAQAEQTFNLSWNVVANGAATMSSTSYTLLSTSGQPIAGESASVSYSLTNGFWADLRTFISDIFLPVVSSS